jgi:hypothetical protein
MAMRLLILAVLALLVLSGCQQGPPPASSPEQQRFMTGCRPVDAARDPTDYEAYCDQF